MTDQLKEDLATLSDAVPLVPKGVSQAVAAAEALEQAAEALLQDVDEARQDVAGQLNRVREALPPLVVQIEVDTGRMAASGDEAAKAWDEAHESLNAAQDRLEKEADEVRAASIELLRHLAEVGTKVDQSQAEGEAAVDLLETEAQEAETKLAAAGQAVAEEVNELKQFLDVARSSLKSACATLAQRLLSLGQEVEQDAGQIIQELKDKQKEHRGHTQEPLENLRDQALSDVEDAEERAQRTAATPVADAGLELRTELERLSVSAEKGEEALRREDQEFDQAMADLGAEAARLPEGIRQIDEAARTLGL